MIYILSIYSDHDLSSFERTVNADHYDSKRNVLTLYSDGSDNRVRNALKKFNTFQCQYSLVRMSYASQEYSHMWSDRWRDYGRIVDPIFKPFYEYQLISFGSVRNGNVNVGARSLGIDNGYTEFITPNEQTCKLYRELWSPWR